MYAPCTPIRISRTELGEVIAARSAIICAANSLFPDTVIGIWTKTQANPTDTHWDMLCVCVCVCVAVCVHLLVQCVCCEIC